MLPCRAVPRGRIVRRRVRPRWLLLVVPVALVAAAVWAVLGASGVRGVALHAFNRASFGTPQSLGCVELPEASAKRVWPYTPIGTLVAIEH